MAVDPYGAPGSAPGGSSYSTPFDPATADYHGSAWQFGAVSRSGEPAAGLDSPNEAARAFGTELSDGEPTPATTDVGMNVSPGSRLDHFRAGAIGSASMN